VTFSPVSIPSRTLKFATDFFAFVRTGFCPAMTASSFSAWLIFSFSPAVAAFPRPIEITIFSMRGTASMFVYPKRCWRAGTTFSL
jgi:hypothetical protein